MDADASEDDVTVVTDCDLLKLFWQDDCRALTVVPKACAASNLPDGKPEHVKASVGIDSHPAERMLDIVLGSDELG